MYECIIIHVQLAVLLLFPEWDASPSQDTQHNVTKGITTSL